MWLTTRDPKRHVSFSSKDLPVKQITVTGFFLSRARFFTIFVIIIEIFFWQFIYIFLIYFSFRFRFLIADYECRFFYFFENNKIFVLWNSIRKHRGYSPDAFKHMCFWLLGLWPELLTGCWLAKDTAAETLRYADKKNSFVCTFVGLVVNVAFSSYLSFVVSDRC